ncbi:MAG: tRNA preQ1(34) S-adenosylmethionine ribosyltransferase-isomerase QueA [Planctomycetota bacterium]
MSELDLYDYHLPEELIAREPATQREGARLLVLHRDSGRIEHRTIADLPQLLQPQDLMVLNDTRVLPARLVGRRATTGGRWEGLFLKSPQPGTWEVIGQTRGKLLPHEDLIVPLINAEVDDPAAASELRLKLVERLPDGGWLMQPNLPGSHVELLGKFGQVPLPPYMERDSATAADRERYQTLHARHPGSVAAPTAGLHFTPELLAACRERGIHDTYVTLHVGLGTFRPISVERLAEHVMHSEWCEVGSSTVDRIQQTKATGGRIVAVGTTSVRSLETASRTGQLTAFSGDTRLFIQPPYQFQTVDVILTNFHLPKSTLLVLLAAFVGRERLLEAYAEAISERYRFYSYGDAMLVL